MRDMKGKTEKIKHNNSRNLEKSKTNFQEATDNAKNNNLRREDAPKQAIRPKRTAAEKI